jgi:hypothetical protein
MVECGPVASETRVRFSPFAFKKISKISFERISPECEFDYFQSLIELKDQEIEFPESPFASFIFKSDINKDLGRITW